MAKDERATVPAGMRPYFDAIVNLTDAVCHEHLTAEYAQLCRRLAAALCRKRPSPVTRGRSASWACGITYAIGSANFLFDPSQKPHLKASDLCAIFGVSPATGGAKATEIRKLFGMHQFYPAWCLSSKLDENPLAWMITVNGVIVDARYATRSARRSAAPPPDPLPAGTTDLTPTASSAAVARSHGMSAWLSVLCFGRRRLVAADQTDP